MFAPTTSGPARLVASPSLLCCHRCHHVVATILACSASNNRRVPLYVHVRGIRVGNKETFQRLRFAFGLYLNIVAMMAHAHMSSRLLVFGVALLALVVD